MKICKDRALDSEAYLLFYVKQGSSPWFSTLLKRKKNSSGDSDEGSYSCSGSDSDSDEQENEGSPETPSWCKDEVRDTNDSPDGALGTLGLRSVGPNSDNISKGKCITSIVQEKAIEDEPIKQFKDMLINKLRMAGLTGSEIEEAAAVILARTLEESQMVFALKASRREYIVETLDDRDKTGLKKRRRNDTKVEGHELGEVSREEEESGDIALCDFEHF
nr:uncharacterized protein LOC127328833 [Lolium perenne]